MTLADINWPLILAGLGLFLFGIDYMGDGLKSYAGDKLKDIIDKYTSSPVKGILIGALVTCLIQSSSGTTALTIGLIRSGLMNLNQAVGIIMGANIGTVITSVLVGLKISKYAVYFIIIGAFVSMFSKNKKSKYLSQIIFGFGCLFYGLDLMGNNLSMISEVPEFTQITEFLMKSPWLGLLGGTILTCAIQSSAATIAIVQQMYGAGAIGLNIALPFLFGSNIGTTITALLASIGQSKNAKRTAVAHSVFNITGSAVFLLVIPVFSKLVQYISPKGNEVDVISRQIANAHTTFNVTCTLIWLPLIPVMVKIVSAIVRGKEDEEVSAFAPQYLDDKLIMQPAAAMYLVSEEIKRSASYAKKTLQLLNELFSGKKTFSSLLPFITKNFPRPCARRSTAC